MDDPKDPMPFIQQRVQLWDNDMVTPLLTSLKVAEGTAEFAQFSNALSSSYTDDHNPSGLPLYRPSFPSQDGTMQCSFCQIKFSNREEQVSHYSLDWHRLNIKRVMEGFTAITEEDFNRPNSPSEDESESEVSDESSSDENEEKSFEEEPMFIAKKPRVFFENSDGVVISLFRNVLFPKKTDASNEAELVQRVMSCPRKLYWVIILVGGGHFSAAIFKGPEALVHKTFHSYTVRAKQGGTQSTSDNKHGTIHPRSAGASLRRYNEKTHWQYIQELLESWKSYLAECDLIFYRCPVSHRAFLFDGHLPILKKGDFRIRTIPFTTKKPTYKEAKRVHHLLSQIVVHAKESYLKENQSRTQTKMPPKKKDSPKKERRRKKQPAKMSMSEKASMDTQEIAFDSSDTEDGGSEEDIVVGFQNLRTGQLEEYGSSIEDSREERKSKDSISSPEPNQVVEGVSPELKTVHNAIYTACRTGDLYLLQSILELHKSLDITNVADCLSLELTSAIFASKDELDLRNIKLGPNEKTLLHIAAENGQKKILWWLLESGCDPTVEDKNNRMPYSAAPSKDTKNQFRKFMAEHPDMYDYVKARIPSPLSKEQEAMRQAKQSQKKKQQRKAKQEKEKLKKKELAAKKAEEEEQKRFLLLSDREKRALAAERRILQQQQASSQTISVVHRCFQCGGDMTGQIPFEYSEYKFCSTKCVKEHRSKNKTT